MGPPARRRRKSTGLSVRKRPPWKPERGQYFKPLGFGPAISERAGFTIVIAVLVILGLLVLFA